MPALAIARTRSLWPLLVLIGGGLALYAFGAHRELSLSGLASRQAELRGYVAAHPAWTPVAFMAAYAAMVACAIPGGVAFSMAAGLLFGIVAGTIYVLLAVTAGSVILLLAARSALRPLLERYAVTRLAKIVAALERDGFSYLLAARLLPFAPFWITNLAAALTRIPVPTFALATIIGIAPITVVLTAAGSGIGETLAAGGQPGLGTVLRPQIAIPLLLTAILSLAPIALRRRQTGRDQAGRKSGTDR